MPAPIGLSGRAESIPATLRQTPGDAPRGCFWHNQAGSLYLANQLRFHHGRPALTGDTDRMQVTTSRAGLFTGGKKHPSPRDVDDNAFHGLGGGYSAVGTTTCASCPASGRHAGLALVDFVVTDIEMTRNIQQRIIRSRRDHADFADNGRTVVGQWEGTWQLSGHRTPAATTSDNQKLEYALA